MSTSLSIVGKVVNLTDQPIAGAVITVTGENVETPYTTVSNEEGQFELRDLPPPGQYLVSASAEGFMDWKKPAVVQPEQPFIVNITLYSESDFE